MIDGVETATTYPAVPCAARHTWQKPEFVFSGQGGNSSLPSI